MSHNDEQTPIRERWTTRPAGADDEAHAGALLRTAAEHGPVEEKRLAELHARLRRSHRSKALGQPAPRLLRQMAFAAGFVLCGGVLSASVMHVMRRPPSEPVAAPASDGDNPMKAKRRLSGARGPNTPVTPVETPTAAPTPAAPVPPVVVSAEPKPSSQTQTQTPSPRLPSPHRHVASRDTPSLAPTPAPMERRGSSPMVSAPSPVAPSPVFVSPHMPPPQPLDTVVERPAPLPAPAQTASAAMAPEPSRLARDSRWLAGAISKLRQEGQPEQALAILDQHRAELESGVLAPEATATRIEALLRLGRNGQALVLLDGRSLSARGPEREMLVARAELRAENGRASSALHDFDVLLSSPGRADGITERALFGRATCRAKSGDGDGARGDFTQYLNAFPQGRFVQEVRSALSRPLR